jgi:hypothetical protein
VKRDELMGISESVKDITAVGSILMMMLIYNSVGEVERFIQIFNLRYFSLTHGQQMPSYA